MEKFLQLPDPSEKASREPIEMLEKAGYEVILNPVGKILDEEEMKNISPTSSEL